MIKNEAGVDLSQVDLRYNLSINGISNRIGRYIFFKNLMGWESWYTGIESDIGNLVDWPHLLPNGSNFVCQFYISHNDATLGAFKILLGYKIYL